MKIRVPNWIARIFFREMMDDAEIAAGVYGKARRSKLWLSGAVEVTVESEVVEE